MVKTLIALIIFLRIGGVGSTFAQSTGYDIYQEKRFVMEFRSTDEKTLRGVVLVIAKPGDDQRCPMELVERQAGLKWSGRIHGDVYRYNPESRKWDYVMSRDVSTTETIVLDKDGLKGRLGLKISELQSGDVIICTGVTVVR